MHNRKPQRVPRAQPITQRPRIFASEHPDGALTVVVSYLGRRVVLDCSSTGPVLTRLFEDGLAVAESYLGRSLDDHDDFIDVPVHGLEAA